MATKEAYENIIYRRRPIEFLDLIKGKMVVDVGCGSGQNCLELQKRGKLVICLDLALRQITEAKKRGCENLIQADMEYLPFRDLSIISLLYIASIHHLRDPHLALNEAKRVLKENGEILVTVWLVQPRFMFRRHVIMKSRLNGREVRRYYRLYYPNELKKIMESVGFKKVKYKVYRVKSFLPNNVMFYGTKSLAI